jgi:hypothetical protein
LMPTRTAFLSTTPMIDCFNFPQQLSIAFDESAGFPNSRWRWCLRYNFSP